MNKTDAVASADPNFDQFVLASVSVSIISSGMLEYLSTLALPTVEVSIFELLPLPPMPLCGVRR